MNKGKLGTAFVSAALTFLALLGGLGCMVSAMGLPASMWLLIAGCAGLSLAFSLCWNNKFWLAPLCLCALLVGYWWQEGTLRLSIESLLFHITELYNRGYGWSILQWSDRSLLGADTAPALLTLAIPIGALFSLSVSKGCLPWLGVGAALLPLGSCLLLKDTVPSNEYLALLLFALLAVALTEGVRRSDARQADRLTGLLALPLTLALALLFTFCPRQTYNGQAGAQALEDFVVGIIEHFRLPEELELPLAVQGDQPKNVDLSTVGRRTPDTERIMTVESDRTATVYLRGCAYDVYDGTNWSCTPGWSAMSMYYKSTTSTRSRLTVRTEGAHSVLYFTYNPPTTEQKVVGGRLNNDNKLTEYTVYYQPPETYDEFEWSRREAVVESSYLQEYLQLPQTTRLKAVDLLTKRVGIPGAMENAAQIWENANYIVEWVSQQADYNLNTAPMPAGEKDFAIWFLKNADTGYCTHFATSAVVLLRAAGIPAQYVTGYLVQTKAGQEVTVTDAQAHAWVEVFINGVGWVVMEPTPGQSTSQPNVPVQTQPTQPPETTQPDESSAPSESTAPSASPQRPTGGTGPYGTTPAAPSQEGTQPTVTQPTLPDTPARQGYSKALLWLLVGVSALVAVIVQWRLRVWLRYRKPFKGDPNRQALRQWQLLHRLCRHTKQQAPAECLALAQKARFSQHTLTREELGVLHQAVLATRQKLKTCSLPRRLLCSIILALH